MNRAMAAWFRLESSLAKMRWLREGGPLPLLEDSMETVCSVRAHAFRPKGALPVYAPP